MKKFICFTLLIAASLISSAAEFKMIPLNTRDITKINQAITDANAANTSITIKLRLQIMKGIVEKNITTFEALKSEVESIVNANTTLTDNQKSEFIKLLIKQFACVGFYKVTNEQIVSSMIKAAYAYAQENPSNYDIYFYYQTYNLIQLTKEQQYAGILNQFKLYGTNFPQFSMINNAITRFIKIAPTTNVTTQKEDLQLLNRIISPRLISNKTVWEPIVVKIRTAIETY